MLLATAMVAVVFGLARGQDFFSLGAVGIAITVLIAIPLGSLMLLAKRSDVPRIIWATGGAIIGALIASIFVPRVPLPYAPGGEVGSVIVGTMVGGLAGSVLARLDY